MSEALVAGGVGCYSFRPRCTVVAAGCFPKASADKSSALLLASDWPEAALPWWGGSASLVSVYMCAMLDATDVEHVVVLEEPKGDSVVTAARDPPPG